MQLNNTTYSNTFLWKWNTELEEKQVSQGKSLIDELPIGKIPRWENGRW